MLAGTVLYLTSIIALAASSSHATPLHPRAEQSVHIIAAQSGVELAREGQGFSTNSLDLTKTPSSFWVRTVRNGRTLEQARVSELWTSADLPSS